MIKVNTTEVLKKYNLKKTAPRVAIISILANNDNPISENDIKEEMGDMYDRVTFYRSVQTLIEVGLIHRIVADNITMYAYNHSEGNINIPELNHVHFFCKKCHSMICLEEVKVRDYKMPKDYIIEDCEVLIKGVCKNCKK
jgi:Fur family transcriptional regulator, ferric uptake regulator